MQSSFYVFSIKISHCHKIKWTWSMEYFCLSRVNAIHWYWIRNFILYLAYSSDFRAKISIVCLAFWLSCLSIQICKHICICIHVSFVSLKCIACHQTNALLETNFRILLIHMVLKKGQNDELSKQMKEILVTDMFIIYPVYHIRNKWELIVLIHGIPNINRM